MAVASPKFEIDTKHDGPWKMYLRLQAWSHFRYLALKFREGILSVIIPSTNFSLSQQKNKKHILRKMPFGQGRPDAAEKSPSKKKMGSFCIFNHPNNVHI